jgi:hypothetical protein
LSGVAFKRDQVIKTMEQHEKTLLVFPLRNPIATTVQQVSRSEYSGVYRGHFVYKKRENNRLGHIFPSLWYCYHSMDRFTLIIGFLSCTNVCLIFPLLYANNILCCLYKHSHQITQQRSAEIMNWQLSSVRPLHNQNHTLRQVSFQSHNYELHNKLCL